MLTLSAKIRKNLGKKTKILKERGAVPAVLYGPKIKNIILEVDLKEFEKAYRESGESSLMKLKLKNQESKIEEFLVLIHAVEIDSISQNPIHVDFYQPNLDEEIIATVPLVFEGEAEAVKNLAGTLIKNFHELEVRALPQNLPHEIKVDIGKLKTFEDRILIKDLIISTEAKIMKEEEEAVAFVSRPEKMEEELQKPAEEKVEEVERVGEKKEEDRGE